VTGAPISETPLFNIVGAPKGEGGGCTEPKLKLEVAGLVGLLAKGEAGLEGALPLKLKVKLTEPPSGFLDLEFFLLIKR
jgi:hypothetical protein